MTAVRHTLLVTLYSLLLLITACGEQNNNNDDQIAAANGGISGTGDGSSSYAYTTGSSYKGPLLANSTITVYQVDAQGVLQPAINTTVIDQFGQFSFQFASEGLYSLQATGFFYNEATGQNSAEQVTLKVLVNMEEKAQDQLFPAYFHANLLTTLIHDDMLNLIQNGNTYDEAYEIAANKASQLFSSMTGEFALSKAFMFIGISPEEAPASEPEVTPPAEDGGETLPPLEDLPPITQPTPPAGGSSLPEENSPIPTGEEEPISTEEELQEDGEASQQDQDDSAFLIYLSSLVTKAAIDAAQSNSLQTLLQQLAQAYALPQPALTDDLLTTLQTAQQNLDEATIESNLEILYGRELVNLAPTVLAVDEKLPAPENFSSTVVTRPDTLVLRCFNFDGSAATATGCNGNSQQAIGYTNNIQISTDSLFPAAQTFYYNSGSNWYQRQASEFSTGTWYIRIRKAWDNGQKGLWKESSFIVN